MKTNNTAHTLRIECDDKTGLIYSVTKVLHEMSLNIVRNGEFVDADRQRFFMYSDLEGNLDSEQVTHQLRQSLSSEAIIELLPKRKKQIVVLATKEHHCLSDLLIRNQFNEINAEILAVISNHQVLENLVSKFQLPFHFVDHKGMSREEHETAVHQLIGSYNPDYLVLAKYMRILTPDFVKEYTNRIINIHHSFLPAFIGANPYRQAYERGVKIIGATAHFVNNDLDEGPIIFQDVLAVNHTYSAKDMTKAGKDVEKIVLAKALKWVFNDRVMINGNKTIIF